MLQIAAPSSLEWNALIFSLCAFNFILYWIKKKGGDKKGLGLLLLIKEM